jgi:multiple sugar transport system ATP-binding protein
MTLGQRVAVMRDGRILQVDAPQRLYERPRDVFVAGFIGSPAMNLVEATLESDDVVVGEHRLPLHPTRRPVRRAGPVVLGVRPESFEDADFASSDLPTLEVEVTVLEELGADAHVFFAVDAPALTPQALVEEGEDSAQLVAEPTALVNARVDPRTRARVGGRIVLATDPGRFHFFDPETGASLLEHEANEPMQVLTTPTVI